MQLDEPHTLATLAVSRQILVTVRQRDVYVNWANNCYQYNSRVASKSAQATMYATETTRNSMVSYQDPLVLSFPSFPASGFSGLSLL